MFTGTDPGEVGQDHGACLYVCRPASMLRTHVVERTNSCMLSSDHHTCMSVHTHKNAEQKNPKAFLIFRTVFLKCKVYKIKWDLHLYLVLFQNTRGGGHPSVQEKTP